MDAISDAPLGAVILGVTGLLIQAAWTAIFLRRVFERDRAGADAPDELQSSVKSMLPLAPIGFLLFSVALFWWSTTQ